MGRSLCLIIMVIVVTISMVAGHPPKPTTALSGKQLLARGESLLNKGDARAAITILEQSLTLLSSSDEDRSSVLSALGQANAMTQRFDVAIQYLKEAITFVQSMTTPKASTAELARAYYNLAYTYEQSGRHDALPLALQNYELAIATDASFSEALVQAAQLANQQVRYRIIILFVAFDNDFPHSLWVGAD
jgi:tetratricopeptide (TPR) repeat protein